jgi:hypothetical protein
MFGKCWSIQYIGHEAYKLHDKVHSSPVYFTVKATMKAIHDWINEMAEECADGTTNIDHITEEFLANTEPGYYDEIFMSNDACFSIVLVCHRIA